MSHTDPERRRLALQASIINPHTERLLRDAGISGGMQVLDMACGVGDVSLIAGRLAGSHGSVTGVDLDADALAVAAGRATAEGLDHMQFIQADLASFEPKTKYDAVIARHILIHTKDPVLLIRKAASMVHAGGLIVFQEYDLSGLTPKYDGMPLLACCWNAITALFTETGLAVRAGSMLYRYFLDAGLPVPECRLEYMVEGGADSNYYEWLGETIKSLEPKLIAVGILREGEIGVETLTERLREEALAARQPFVVGPMGAAFVRTPIRD